MTKFEVLEGNSKTVFRKRSITKFNYRKVQVVFYKHIFFYFISQFCVHNEREINAAFHLQFFFTQHIKFKQQNNARTDYLKYNGDLYEKV